MPNAGAVSWISWVRWCLPGFLKDVIFPVAFYFSGQFACLDLHVVEGTGRQGPVCLPHHCVPSTCHSILHILCARHIMKDRTNPQGADIQEVVGFQTNFPGEKNWENYPTDASCTSHVLFNRIFYKANTLYINN